MFLRTRGVRGSNGSLIRRHQNNLAARPPESEMLKETHVKISNRTAIRGNCRWVISGSIFFLPEEIRKLSGVHFGVTNVEIWLANCS
ncbi:hypothetical protein PGT21_032345 [Puccinia graminis f. sp. tritici]|uniref:Uncharacterized protein n=1 Tax=Puccinia graminis f. sp. tritici TaxID=56615 RepID=A0A5B0MZ66_PUCGR|nr:hypothetical protein PGT21_032345 [Puccinia graminis f. sp. tritici]